MITCWSNTSTNNARKTRRVRAPRDLCPSSQYVFFVIVRAIPTSVSSITTHSFSLWHQWIQPRRQGPDRCLQTSWFISSTRQLVLWLSSRRWSSNLFGVKVEVLTLVHDIWLENLGSTWSGAPCVKTIRLERVWRILPGAEGITCQSTVPDTDSMDFPCAADCCDYYVSVVTSFK